MRKLIEFSQKNPIIIIALLALGALFSSLNVGKLWIDSSTKSMMMLRDPDLTYYNETCEKFGSDMMMVIYVEDDDLFTVEKLRTLDSLVSDLGIVPGVRRSESLFSVGNLKNEEGLLDNTPLMEEVPASQAEANAVRDDAIKNPLILNSLISPDGKKTAINLYLEPAGSEDQDLKRATAVGVAKYIEQYREDFDEIFEIGAPYTEKALTDMIMGDMRILLPIAFLTLLLMLFITTGSLNGAILPFITSSLSILYTLGFMGFFGLPFNLLTFVIPVLVIVIGSTEDIHMLSSYQEGLHEKGNRKLAILFMARSIGVPVLLTAVTTFLGFLAISLNRVLALIQFGLIAGFALLINPLITVTFAPIYLSYFGAKSKKRRMGSGGFFTKLLRVLSDKIIYLLSRRKKIVLVSFILIAVGIGAFSYRIRVNNDTPSFFPKDSPVITRTNHIHQELSGIHTFFVRFTSNRRDTFRDPRYMNKVAAVQELMAKDYSFDKTISITDFIKLTNREFNFGDPQYYIVPDSEELISQYTLFLHRDEIESYVTHDWSEANILVRHNITSSDDLKDVLARLNQDIVRILEEPREDEPPAEGASEAKDGFGNLKTDDDEALLDSLFEQDPATEPAAPEEDIQITFGITGERIVTDKAADTIAFSQATSIVALLITILIIMTILFLNFKAGLLSLVPNIIPIVVFFGIMGIFDIPLNVGTCMVATIAIGISIDDTIHFMTRFNQEMRRVQDKTEAIKATIRTELRPIVSTSIALALGFVILSQSHLTPIIYFGILSAVVVVCALAADLFLTPLLLTTAQFINLSEIAGLKLASELKNAPIFEGMNMLQIKQFVLLGQVVQREAGEEIMRYGEKRSHMCVLLNGKIRVVRPLPEEGKSIFLAKLVPGDIFGEISMLRKRPRSASVVAEQDVSYLQIDWKGFQRISRSSKSIAAKIYFNIAKILGKRLVDMDERTRA